MLRKYKLNRTPYYDIIILERTIKDKKIDIEDYSSELRLDNDA